MSSGNGDLGPKVCFRTEGRSLAGDENRTARQGDTQLPTRSTDATLAVGAGISGEAVAASLGHESFAVTAAHYAQPEAVSGAKAAKVADILG